MAIWFRKSTLGLLPLVLLLSLAACGGGSSPSSSTSGTVYVGGTDAPGDFLDYTVTFQSLTLTRKDGTVVQVLPNVATIDLAQDDALTDLLAAAVVPAGTYTSAVATIDYTGATIVAVGANGEPVTLTPVNEQGQTLGTLEVPIDFGSDANLVVEPGQSQFLVFDFALAASNTINLSTNPPTVVVAPFLDATIGVSTNPVRLRGPLVSVNVAAGTYTIGVRPFYTGATSGSITITTTASTVYDVSGVSYQGSAGLTALASLPPLSATSARVTYDPTTGAFTATTIYAGTSVPGDAFDAVRGTVTSITGNVLTVLGATLIRSDGTMVYDTSVPVTVGTETLVHEDGVHGSLPTSAISVGQRIIALGTLSGSLPSSLDLDASPGEVRLAVTQLRGTVTATSSGSLAMDLLTIDRRPVSLFNFAGTGTSTANDANPQDYVVATGALPLAGFGIGDPIRVSGFVTPYGSAPPDFDALGIADYTNARAIVFLDWLPPGTMGAFSTLSDTAIVPNLSSNPSVDVLIRGEVSVDLTTLAQSPSIVPATSGRFLIRQNGTVTVHETFVGFINDLTARLSAGAPVEALWARGGFDATNDVLTASLVTVRLG